MDKNYFKIGSANLKIISTVGSVKAWKVNRKFVSTPDESSVVIC